jgi:hypothetical protein
MGLIQAVFKAIALTSPVHKVRVFRASGTRRFKQIVI